MPITTRLVDYDHDGLRCEGFAAIPDDAAGPRPGLLIAHTWAGRNDFVMDKARELAAMGYVAFALDMYGAGRVGQSVEDCAALMGDVMRDRVLLQHRITAALSALQQLPEVDPQRIAALGFCFGGLCVLDLARTGASLRGVISFHGLFTPPENPLTAPIVAKVLVLHGFEDPMATPEQAVELGRELTARGADWQLHWFGHTQHAFTNPLANDPALGTVYNAAADRRAGRCLTDFLDEVLK